MAQLAAEQALDAGALITATAALIGGEATQTARFGIAVSGGPDSLALLLLAHLAFPGCVAAATIDHQLRPESAAEAQLVAALCAQIGVAHTILMPREPITGSLQASARATRYALLEEWRAAGGIDWLMTAHHADDQLETLVMRLNRGSGVAGLSGIRARHGHVLRPLLAIRRSALVALVQSKGWIAIDDPSNRDDRFDRARVRKALAVGDLLDADAVAQSAAVIADADEALDWAMKAMRAERTSEAGGGFDINVADLPIELRRRLILHALRKMEPGRKAPRGDVLTRAIAAVEGGVSAMIGDTCLKPSKSNAEQWQLRPAPPRGAR